MSERETVHKEMDKMQEELISTTQKLKKFEQSSNDSSKEVWKVKRASFNAS